MILFMGITTFLLVRHGESDWNRDGRLQGKSKEAQLTLQGKEQAKDTATLLFQAFKDKEVEIWTSGLLRADQTAAIIAEVFNYPKNAIRVEKGLEEASHGRLEGQPASVYEIDPSYKKWKTLSAKEKFFNAMDETAESHEKVALRAKKALQEIGAQNSEKVKIIVTHGALINALRKDLTGTYEFPGVKNGEIVMIQGDNQQLSLSNFETLNSNNT